MKKKIRSFFDKAISPLNQVMGRFMMKSRDREEIHTYWRSPWDESNRPEQYITSRTAARSRFLTETIRKYAGPDSRILEIGCNVGRNLNHLYHAGFRNLSGLEINEEAVALLRQFFPDMADNVHIYNKSVEEGIHDFADGEFDIVFTMAVLEHIHPSSEWVFPEMVRVTKNNLVTIEDEKTVSWRHFPRNYGSVFSSHGMREIESLNCKDDANILSRKFFLRVFQKE